MSATPAHIATEPRRKRPRSHSATSDGTNTFTRDDRFYYADGNIIVVAQGVGFRVYKGLLAENSEVFRAMFDFPPPKLSESPGSAVDACPVIHVTDTAAEFRSLLGVLLHGKQYMQRRTEAIDFKDVANCIRLAHKYDIQDVLAASLTEMQLYYPEDFSIWEVSPLDLHDVDAISAVQLARLTSTPSILPSALYACALLPADKLLHGHERDDGVVDTLSTEDLTRCIEGKARLCTRMVQIIHDIFAPANNPKCTSPGYRCETGIAAILLHEVHRLEQGDGTVLQSWTNVIDALCEDRDPKPHLPLCKSCVDFLYEREQGVRAQVWSELPKIFRLEESRAGGDGATGTA